MRTHQCHTSQRVWVHFVEELVQALLGCIFSGDFFYYHPTVMSSTAAHAFVSAPHHTTRVLENGVRLL